MKLNLKDFKIQRENKSKKVKSPFINYCLSVVGCLVVFSICFVFLAFETDAILNYDNVTLGRTLTFNRTSMQSVSDSLSSGNIVSNGGDTTTPNVPGVSPGIIQNGNEINMSNALSTSGCDKFCYTYMAWQLITSKSSLQYKLRALHYPNWNRTEGAPEAWDAEGFGVIEGRYVVACTSMKNGGIANVGDKLDVYLENGNIIQCIVGDIKSSGDSNWTPYGHKHGNALSSIEFVVDKRVWYNSGHSNPGTTKCHPEWNSPITKIIREEVDWQ